MMIPINSQTIILEEIKKILTSKDNNDYNCISLYDVAILLRKLRTEYDNMEKQFNNTLDYYMEKNFSEDSFIILYDFDFENKLLHIGFQIHFDINDLNKECMDIYFAKRNGDLYIAKTQNESYPDKLFIDDVFNVLSSKLSIMYDEFLTYADYKDYKNSKNINPISSLFDVYIGDDAINIHFKNDLYLIALSCSNKYNIKCNSNIVIESIKGKENEIFKRIFVNISDCPIWCQKQLLEIRKKQLELKQKQLELKQKQLDELKQRQEEQIKYEEMKRQKRLTLIKKIFPFIKND